jgi:hypothetical protein
MEQYNKYINWLNDNFDALKNHDEHMSQLHGKDMRDQNQYEEFETELRNVNFAYGKYHKIYRKVEKVSNFIYSAIHMVNAQQDNETERLHDALTLKLEKLKHYRNVILNIHFEANERTDE